MWCVNKEKYSPRLGLPQNQSHLYSKVLYTLFFLSSLSYRQPVHPQRDKGGNHPTLWSWRTPTGCCTRLHEVISGNFLSNICYLAWDWWCCSTGQWTPRTTLYFSLFGCRLPQTFHSAPTWLVSWRFALSASNESLCVTSLHYDMIVDIGPELVRAGVSSKNIISWAITTCCSELECDTRAEPEAWEWWFFSAFEVDFLLLNRDFEVLFFRCQDFIVRLHERVKIQYEWDRFCSNPNLGLDFPLFTHQTTSLIIYANGCNFTCLGTDHGRRC